jgi:hypothetical protein
MTNSRLLAGGLLVVVPLVFVAGFTGLQLTFDYPDILRFPAGEVLSRFAAGGMDLHLYWYAMFAAALGLVPAAIGVAALWWKENPFVAAFAGGLGALAGLVQAMGLLRWVMLVPVVAADYAAPGATDMDKALAVSGFEMANAYLGMGVGEHMGYFFTALWTVSVAALVWGRWTPMAWAAIVLALGVAAGMLEPFGVPYSALINTIAFSVWPLWAVTLGVLVLWRGVPAGVASAAAVA